RTHAAVASGAPACELTPLRPSATLRAGYETSVAAPGVGGAAGYRREPRLGAVPAVARQRGGLREARARAHAAHLAVAAAVPAADAGVVFRADRAARRAGRRRAAIGG